MVTQDKPPKPERFGGSNARERALCGLPITQDGVRGTHRERSATRGSENNQASGIRAGTPDSLRNILGERVLGLPKD